MKHVGWMLNDSAREVRRACLEWLCKMFENKTICCQMREFLGQFKNRIIQMKLDVSNDCGILAIRTLKNIMSNRIELGVQLSRTDCVEISKLTFSIHRPLAVAAGDFLTEFRFSSLLENDGEFTSRGERLSQNVTRFIALIDFYTRVEINNHTTYLVDALWDSNSEWLTDWEGMCQLLLDDRLESDQELALIDILLRSTVQEKG